METIFSDNWNCFRESQKLPPSPPSLFSPQGTPPPIHSLSFSTNCFFFFKPVVAGISTVWWHRTVLEPDKWIFNQLHGRILCSSIPSQVQQQNYRDVLSFRYNSSVYCSVQYIQKVYGCCSGFFVTVNLWLYAASSQTCSLFIKVKNHHLDMIIRNFKISWTFTGKRDDPPWDQVESRLHYSELIECDTKIPDSCQKCHIHTGGMGL